MDSPDCPDKQQRAEALREQIDELTARQDRLITELETTDPYDRTFRDRLRRRFDALEAERTEKATQLQGLERNDTAEPEQDVSLLDALPILTDVNITQAPERIQRKLYDALQLQIHYDRPDNARFRIVLTDDIVDAFATSGGTATELPVPGARKPATPPGTRTCARVPTTHRLSDVNSRRSRQVPRRHVSLRGPGTRRGHCHVHTQPRRKRS